MTNPYQPPAPELDSSEQDSSLPGLRQQEPGQRFVDPPNSGPQVLIKSLIFGLLLLAVLLGLAPFLLMTLAIF